MTTETTDINHAKIVASRNLILEQISKLENMKTELENQLKNDAGTLLDAQKISISNQITNINEIKVYFLQRINDMYEYYLANVNNTNNVSIQQQSVLNFFNNENRLVQDRLDMLNGQKNDKVKLVQINTYYGKYYNARKQIMVTIVLICLPVLILTILGNMGILPSNLYALLIMIIIIIGSISIGYQIIDLSNRDNMNFDEYNWKFNKKLAPSIKTNVTPYDPWEPPVVSCTDGACCPEGYRYDNNVNINKCVVLTP
jgi:hypothetical protein